MSRRGRWLVAVVAVLGLTGTSLGGWYFFRGRKTLQPGLVTHPIKKEKLQLTITERGSLEPADNTYIPCKVKAKTPGSPSTSIRWVIDNGTPVKEGDKILELDDSALQDQLQTQQIAVLDAEKLWKQAELTLAINLLTNEAMVGQQKTNKEVAVIALREYIEGQYVISRIDLENKRIMAASDLTMWRERASWSDRMSRPGRQFVTASQAESDETRRNTADLTLKNFRKQYEVLDITKEKMRVQLQGVIDEAERQIQKAQKLLEKQREGDEVAVRSSYAVYDKQLSKLRDIEKEIDNCFIRAPRDGMVVYYVEERARFGQSGGVIAQGELVKEGQKLLAVPDLKKLVLNARIHEAMVSRVKDDVMKETGFSEAVNSALLFTPDPFGALFAYITFDMDMQNAFSSSHARQEKKRQRRGMDAIVQVNAFPDRPLKAHVKSVAPVASQTDFFNSDVKVYQTYIGIDDDRLEGLKPGMDAVVKIYVDTTPEPVRQIPLQALMGGADMGNKRHCFVLVEGRPEMRDITLGMANETVAEVKDGLEEGDMVVLNPGVLLSDKEKVEYGVSATPSNQGGRGGPGAATKGGKGGRGKGGPGMPGAGPGGAPGSAPGQQGGGPRSQGGAASGGKAAANP